MTLFSVKLKNLFAGTTEKMLESEPDEHLGCDRSDVTGNSSGNSRNQDELPHRRHSDRAPALPYPPAM
ncbi:MAG: hypothetical protein LBL09_01735 [Oscillospiraceae bacterium]|jgi:hypothetical protein|nr:hypothetical protein [Oscillospiraceae bacterium]